MPGICCLKCPSVCLAQHGTASQCLSITSKLFCCLVTSTFALLRTKLNSKILTATRVLNTGVFNDDVYMPHRQNAIHSDRQTERYNNDYLSNSTK